MSRVWPIPEISHLKTGFLKAYSPSKIMKTSRRKELGTLVYSKRLIRKDKTYSA
jgi:hypothetical protein